MPKVSSLIHLNGKQYDARTGQVFGAPTTYTMKVKPLTVHPRPTGATSIDGIVAGGHSFGMHKTVKSKKPQAHHPNLPARSPHFVAAHKPQRSTTLMRRAVKLPGGKINPVQNLLTPLDTHSSMSTVAALKPKLASDTVDIARAQRAKVIQHSPMIQHFTPLSLASSQAKKPVTMPASVAVHTKSTPVHTLRKQSNIFEDAIARAKSHEELPPPETRLRAARRHTRRHKKAVGISASIAVFLLLIGAAAYLNRGSIQLQIASSKAGFHVVQPQYKPDGYSLSTFTHNAGTVAFAYHNDQNQTYSVVQKKSNWDSQTLLDNYVATSDQSYQGYSANGRTVYVYGDGNATWVNGGIWYQIHANKTLPNEQLVKVAASM